MPIFNYIERSRVGARHAYTALVSIDGEPVRFYIMRNRRRGPLGIPGGCNMRGPHAWTALGENGVNRDASTLRELDAWFGTAR